MNTVNHIRFLLASFAMVFTVGVLAEDGPVQMDSLQLDSSLITGNQELPKVLYIVPWKEIGIGDLQGMPVNSLLDEVLAPLDREVFKRQIQYFDQLYVSEKVKDIADD
ncbi:MAG: hypothetical protein GY727_04440 [Gammaproteobacteria bacterium]|nr:hypothetical protein [Gammaproteobacteria bacterium]MCP4090090.1 hypothetical protein [Gammaproteobacteria bacterium]MCP4277020.1 hypothetical protein [Gammaproteobacteria bacterium]MCP4832757.1 hypothetical protein [Gammaproteobacteria bacterium]MCP4929950.1 hypothetical protein [Gammaproteobacteria bacterium]